MQNIANIYPEEIKHLFTIFGKDNIRLVGGAVRNFLLGKEIKDFDMATKLAPKIAMELLQEYNVRVIPTGLKHGTITAIMGEYQVEITTLRQDREQDGRHAKVVYTDDYQVDAGRRDFTFNALYADADGEIYDYFEGKSDLKKGIIRFIGNPEERIKEDYLRILRFFRFFVDYAYVMDYKGFEACYRLKEGIKQLSLERIRDELFKIMSADYPLKALVLMQRIGLLQIIFGTSFDFKYFEIFLSLKKYINHNFTALECFTLLLLNNRMDGLQELLKLSNKEISFLEKTMKCRDSFSSLEKNTIKELLFYGFDKDVVRLAMIDYCIKNYNGDVLEKINNSIRQIDLEEVPAFTVSGNDLKEVGFSQTRDFSRLLLEGKKYFVEKNFSATKEEIIRHLKAISKIS